VTSDLNYQIVLIVVGLCFGVGRHHFQNLFHRSVQVVLAAVQHSMCGQDWENHQTSIEGSCETVGLELVMKA
jgi:hypothetical protein